MLNDYKTTLYTLKRAFGRSATVYKLLTDNYNTNTGAITKNYQSQSLTNFIVFPNDLKRKFAYSISYLAADKNFTYGGMYDVNTREAILDKRDLTLFTLDTSCYFLMDNKKFNIEVLETLEDNLGYYLVIKALQAG